MADLLKLVTFDGLKKRTILDLEQAGTYVKQRDSFRVASGQLSRASVPVVGRYGGSLPSSEFRSNGTVGATWNVKGATGDGAIANLQAFLLVLDSVAPGRYLEWRPDGATRSVYYEIRGSATWSNDYAWNAFSGALVIPVSASWEVAPLAFYDYMDVELYPIDSIADFTFDAGGGTVTAAGGKMVPSSGTTKRARYTGGGGYTYRDVSVTVGLETGATIGAGFGVTCIARSDGTSANWVGARFTSTAMTLIKCVANVQTVLSTSVIALNAATRYWFRCFAIGNCLYAEYTPIRAVWAAQGPAVGSTGTPAVLTPTEAAIFKDGVCGFEWDVDVTSERLIEFRINPFVCPSYHTAHTNQLDGPIPGDAPAHAELMFHTAGSVVRWVGASWAPLDYWTSNHHGGGGAEQSAEGQGGLNVTTSTYLNGGGTLTRDTVSANSKSGQANLTTTAPANNDGISYRNRTFLTAGEFYAVWAWARGNGGSRLVEAFIGNSSSATGAGLHQETVTATAYTLLAAVYQPQANDERGWEAGTRAKTGALGAYRQDGFGAGQVFPGILNGNISSGAASATIYSAPSEWTAEMAQQSFMAILSDGSNAEMVLCSWSPLTPTTVTLVARAYDGGTASGFNTGSYLFPLPRGERQVYDYGGGSPAFGMLSAESAYATTFFGGGTSGIQSDSNALNGQYLGYSAAPPNNAGYIRAKFIVDPGIYQGPDEFSDAVEVDVYARLLVDSRLVSPYITAYSTSNLLGATNEPVWSTPHGSNGKSVPQPSSGTNHYRTFHVGAVRLRWTRDANDAQSMIVVEFGWSGNTGGAGLPGFDSIFLMPVQSSARGKEGGDGAGYPYVSSDTATVLAHWTHDWQGFASRPDSYHLTAETPSASLGGRPFSPLPGSGLRLFVHALSIQPNEVAGTAPASESEFLTGSVRALVRPRAQLARGA